MKTSRRAFILGGMAAVGAAGAVSFHALSLGDEDAIASLVRAAFPAEDFAAGDLAEFARVAAEWRGPFSRGQLLAMESSWLREATDRLTDKDVRTIPGRIIADFVRSSDILDPDQTGQVTYFGYASPYAVGCSNPLPFYADAEQEWPDAVYS